jgi:hypothetical protein
VLVKAMLQHEQQQGQPLVLPTAGTSSSGAVCTAGLPLLVNLSEHLLIALAQLQQQQQQQPSGAKAGALRGNSDSWVSHACLCDLLWATAGLDALLSARTAASRAAAEQMHRLLKQGWLKGGSSSSSSKAEGLWSQLPLLSASQLDARRTQLVAGLVDVLAAELGQQQQLAGHGRSAALAHLSSSSSSRFAASGAATGALPATPATAGSAEAAGAQVVVESAASSRRCSMCVCAALVLLLASAVTPEKPQPNYQLLLEKAASQEEFIPGQLPAGGLVTANALAAAAAAAAAGGGGSGGAAAGPLMRDVKSYICARLDMAGEDGALCSEGLIRSAALGLVRASCCYCYMCAAGHGRWLREWCSSDMRANLKCDRAAGGASCLLLLGSKKTACSNCK